MGAQVLLKKGASCILKRNVTSPRQAKRLSKAIRTLQGIPIDKLEKRGIVKKLGVPDRNDVYMYRAGLNERIVFSPFGKDYVVHDIMFVDKNKSVKSLLCNPKIK